MYVQSLKVKFVNVCSRLADLFMTVSENTSLIIDSLQKYRYWIVSNLSSDKYLEIICTPSKSSRRRPALRSGACAFSDRKHITATKALGTFLPQSGTHAQPLVNPQWAKRTARGKHVQNILCKRSWHASEGATHDILNVFLLLLLNLSAFEDFWEKVDRSFYLSQDAISVQDLRFFLTVI